MAKSENWRNWLRERDGLYAEFAERNRLRPSNAMVSIDRLLQPTGHLRDWLSQGPCADHCRIWRDIDTREFVMTSEPYGLDLKEIEGYALHKGLHASVNTEVSPHYPGSCDMIIWRRADAANGRPPGIENGGPRRSIEGFVPCWE